MQYMVSLAATLGAIAALSVNLFSLSRIVMAASRDWLLPPFLARISPRTQTPLIAQLLFGVISGAWGFVGDGSHFQQPCLPPC
jgi:APA family basic amino acid/polyamine antiporter